MPDAIPLVAATDPSTAIGRDAGVGGVTLRPAAGAGDELPLGWYVVRGQVGQPSPGPMHLVCDPPAGAEPILLQLLDAGAVAPDYICRIPLPTRGLLLRPVKGVDETLSRGADLHLHPVGRMRALALMLAAQRQRGGWRSVQAIAACLTDAVAGLATGGAAGAARSIHGHYLQLVRHLERQRTGIDTSPQAEVRLRPAGGLARSRRVQMVPADQLDAVGTALAPAWLATGADPKFTIPAASLGRPLPAGWYRFRVRLQAEEGHVVGPCLYPDYGQGESEGALVPLGDPDEHGRIDLLVLLREPTRALRFDPTMRQSRFVLDDLRIERLGRLGAFVYMLSRLGPIAGRSALHQRVASLARFIVDLPRKGLPGATSELFRRYHDSTVNSQSSYASWVSRYDHFSALELQSLAERAARIVDGPLISILVPVYQTPERWLRRCIDSVLAQAYPHWELCLADDASQAPHVQRVLAEYAARDRRIRTMRRESNGHISLASNSALELATGGYIGLLDHDDELRPHALLEVVEALRDQPGLKVLYSDEDKIDEHGRRFDPYFKPDWNPDLMRSQNYLCHFSVIDAALLRSVGGFRQGYEGSQDHDLLLRCTERVAAAQVHHIPRVLYHWRAIAGSTALVRDAKDYAADAGARAVADHLVRIGADARVEQMPHGHYRVHWNPGTPPPKVSLVIPTRDRVDLLRTCVESLLERTDYPNFEIVVVDNQSSEPATLEYLAGLERDGRARVLRYDAPFNYSAINNWAVSQCDGAVIGLLNNDMEVITPGWLREMAGHAMRPDVGAVGAMLYYPTDTIQHAGVILGIGGVANHAYLGQPRGYPGHGGRAKVAQGLTAVTGACLLVRREVYEQVGGLDETLKVAFNDVDLCLRLRQAGLHNVWTPFAEFYHYESASRGSEDTPEKAARFRGEVERMQERWGEQLYWDPAYNPNLTLFGTDFGYGFPPRVVRHTSN